MTPRRSLGSFLAGLRETYRCPWSIASWMGLLGLIASVVPITRASGITLDEDVHREYGDLILAWFRSGMTDARATSFGNLYLYGGLFDTIAQWVVSLHVSPWPVFETRHVLTALTAVLGIVGTWKIANQLGGPRAGFLGAACLALTPMWVGHGFFNPKDIPFGAATAFVLYATVRICLAPAPLPWSEALRAGCALGIALAVRPGGLFMLGYPICAAGAKWLIDARTHTGRARIDFLVRAGALACARGMVMLALAWSLMLSCWPWAQQRPLVRPFLAASEATHFEWRNMVLFNGQRIWSYELPASYLSKWFSITLPEIYLLAALCMLVSVGLILRRRSIDPARALPFAALALSIAAPLVVVAIKRPIVYDAQRHFLFLLPALAALSGTSVSYVIGDASIPRTARALVVLGGLGLGAITIVDMKRLHPYEYIYFNRLFGGLRAAEGRFETDYWGAANREGLEWVVDRFGLAADKPIRTAICYASWQIDYYKAQWGDRARRFKAVKNADKARLFIATTRDNCHKSSSGTVLHTVEREGVPLVQVMQR